MHGSESIQLEISRFLSKPFFANFYTNLGLGLAKTGFFLSFFLFFLVYLVSHAFSKYNSIVRTAIYKVESR